MLVDLGVAATNPVFAGAWLTASMSSSALLSSSRSISELSGPTCTDSSASNEMPGVAGNAGLATLTTTSAASRIFHEIFATRLRPYTIAILSQGVVWSMRQLAQGVTRCIDY